MNFSIGRSWFGLPATVNSQQKLVGVSLSMYGDQAKMHYHLLLQDKAAIEAEFGEPLSWEELPGKKESRLAVRRPNSDPGMKSDWPQQFAWMREKLERFDNVFRDRVKALDTSQRISPSVVEDEPQPV
jgi:hypothetical protein